MIKNLFNGNQTRDSLIRGCKQLSEIVGGTLGPKGMPVHIEYTNGLSYATKDGVTVASHVSIENQLENMGLSTLREAANATNQKAGDGTTTSIIIGSAILEEVEKISKNCHPVSIEKGMRIALDQSLQFIKNNVSEINYEKKDIQNIATISANGDEEIGKMVAELSMKVGEEGVITAEKGHKNITTSEVVNGLQFNSGWSSPVFVTDPSKQEAILNDVCILIYDDVIARVDDIVSILQKVFIDEKKSFLLICSEVENEALQALIINRTDPKHQHPICIANCPEFGDKRLEILKDIGLVTGGDAMGSDSGRKLSEMDIGYLGRANKVIVGKDKTIIVGGFGNDNNVKSHISDLKIYMEEVEDVAEKVFVKNRIASLTGGVGVIKVGGMTDVEVNEKRDRVIDAISATKSAREEGVLPGGGVSLLRASIDLFKNMPYFNEKGVEEGYIAFAKALRYPIKRIIYNCGESSNIIPLKGWMDRLRYFILEDSGSTEETIAHIIWKIASEKEFEFGYNARDMKFENLINSGIVDPAKVVRLSMENAASVASMIITASGAITYKLTTVERLPNGHFDLLSQNQR